VNISSLTNLTTSQYSPTRQAERNEPFETFEKGWGALGQFPSRLSSLSRLFGVPQAPPGMELDIENDIEWDGFFLGANDSLDSKTSANLETVKPCNGKTADETVYLVNGIMTDVKLQRSDMQALANTGKEVIGVHNATAGLVYDLAQCLDDKAGTQFSDNKATVATKRLINKALDDGKPLHLVAHSQGALVVCNAATDVIEGLIKSGRSVSAAEEAMKNIKITTFGGAAQYYPDGPDYTHIVNQADVVPMGTGVGGFGWLGRPGRGATIHKIDVTKEPHDLPDRRKGIQNWLARYVDRTTHGPQDIYFNHAPWVSPEDPKIV
jgi:hypothetical protein